MESACSLSSTQRIVRFGRIFGSIVPSTPKQGAKGSTVSFFRLGRKTCASQQCDRIIGVRSRRVKYPASQQQNFSLEGVFGGSDDKSPGKINFLCSASHKNILPRIPSTARP